MDAPDEVVMWQQMSTTTSNHLQLKPGNRKSIIVTSRIIPLASRFGFVSVSALRQTGHVVGVGGNVIFPAGDVRLLFILQHVGDGERMTWRWRHEGKTPLPDKTYSPGNNVYRPHGGRSLSRLGGDGMGSR